MVEVKLIRLSDHAWRYATKRGFTVDEVENTIRTAPWQAAELGRLECRKDFVTAKNGTAEPMRRSRFGRCSSRKPQKLLW